MITQVALAENYDHDNLAYTNDLTLELSYKILFTCLHNELKNLKNADSSMPINCLKSRTLKRYVDRLKKTHVQLISDRSKTVQDLFVLHQTINSLYRYNTEFLNLTYQEYRSRVLYPNIIYMMVRILSRGHKFLQTTIKSVYAEIFRKSYQVIYSHINTFYLDHDIIKNDVLYEFLGNGMKKFDPLTIRDITKFYKSTFRQVFGYYFRKEKRVNTIYDSVWEIEQCLENLVSMPVRLGLYRDVLFDLQTRKFYDFSPTMTQLSYNFKIFKNVIINNEFQDVYFSSYRDTFIVNNSEYKLIKLFNDDISKNGILEQIKKLPTIYKLLKCVHIINPNSRPYNEMMIKPKTVKQAVLEELMHPFKNMLSDEYIYVILEKVADNFTSTILTGEYVNLFTLDNVKIEQITFIQQLRKFINICLEAEA